MGFASPWEDDQARTERTGRVSGANPNGPPGVNRGPAGAPAAPQAGANSPWQGYSPGYLGRTGGATPGSGWGYYYASDGRPTGAGALSNLARNFNYNTTDQSDLSRAGVSRATKMIEEGDPRKLTDEYYRRGENIALRAGQAARDQELADVADSYAATGMYGSGLARSAEADVRRRASQARLSALSDLSSQALAFGEQAAIGRLGAGMPWENSDLGRRMENTAIENRGIDRRTDLAASAARAAGSGYERILEIPGFGEVPESMLPYIGQMMGML